MSQPSASHRSILLLLLVMGATRGLTFSRGSLNEVGLECFSLILIGLFFTMFVGGPWQGASETRGGMSIWLVLLPCAYFFVFGAFVGKMPAGARLDAGGVIFLSAAFACRRRARRLIAGQW